MNRKAFIVFVLVAALATGLGSCKSAPKKADSAKDSLDWSGVYTGTIPGADVSEINVRLTLNQDLTYELKYEYVGKGDPANWTGSFQWDDSGDVVILSGIEEAPSQYKVAENKVIQLDMQGQPISGELADNYVLQKEQQ